MAYSQNMDLFFLGKFGPQWKDQKPWSFFKSPRKYLHRYPFSPLIPSSILIASNNLPTFSPEIRLFVFWFLRI